MLGTVVLLLLCALAAMAGIPLILKLVPPNDYFGVCTENTRTRKNVWYQVNRFGGWALFAASIGTVFAVLLWNNTLLRPFWTQLLFFVLLVAVATVATLVYERHVVEARNRRRAMRGTEERATGS